MTSHSSSRTTTIEPGATSSSAASTTGDSAELDVALNSDTRFLV
ncbi:hypothetical protein YT1_2720 [Rhodococcus ruber]|nr:hypothetical protein YT1_2720 [Rhodococcus ruber]